MNLRVIRDWHKRKAEEMLRLKCDASARAHALRSLQIEKIMQIRKEVRDANRTR